MKYGNPKAIHIVGDKPPWLTIGGLIQYHPCVDYEPRKNFNVRKKLAYAMQLIPDELFVYMNDDFLLLEEYKPVLYSNNYSLDTHSELIGKNSTYCQSLLSTRDFLLMNGVQSPISFELHVPMPMQPNLLFGVLTKILYHPVPVGIRSAYGNLADHSMDVVPIKDCKIHHRIEEDLRERKAPFVSFSDASFTGHLIQHLTDLFPTPAIWESDSVL